MRLANGKTQRALPTFIKIWTRTGWCTGDCCRVSHSLHGKRQTARRKRNETTPLDYGLRISAGLRSGLRRRRAGRCAQDKARTAFPAARGCVALYRGARLWLPVARLEHVGREARVADQRQLLGLHQLAALYAPFAGAG